MNRKVKHRKKRLYDDYDIEQSYKQNIESLSEHDLEEMLRSGKVSCLYRTATVHAGRTLVVDCFPVFRMMEDIPRERRKESSQAQRQLNTKKSCQELINRVNANFGEGDYWITLEYDQDHLPETIDDAQRILRNYFARVNRRLKKKGLEKLKYIYVTEYSDPKSGKEKRVHHHVIYSCGLSRDEMEDLWKHGQRTKCERLHPDPNTWLTGLATYLCKGNYERKSGQRRWNCSVGLKKPKRTFSYSRFRKKDVREMAENRNCVKEKLEQSYSGYRLVDYRINWNEINESWYVHAQMIRN